MPSVPDSVAARERLFGQLDKERSHPFIWVCGPAGAGKTTLVASYLARSAREVLWYRADRNDIDLPTIFHNLREGALAIEPSAALKLPLLTPEYLLDVDTFTRNFMRSLFEVLPRPAALVIDNTHEASAGPMEQVLKVAVEELPADMRLFAIGRNALPGALTALGFKGLLATLQWDQLRLTAEEAYLIASEAGMIEAVDRLYALSDGWVAGFVLLLEHAKRTRDGLGTRARRAISPEFDHFFGELFASAPASTQHLLLCTALLPSFTCQQAAAFTSESQAREVIDWLMARHFFIDARAGAVPVYRYHDLFRGFLLELGRADVPPAVRRAMLVRAAQSAERSGEMEDAFALAVEAESWQEATRLIGVLAPLLLQQGRSGSLDRLIASMPTPIVDTSAWLLYWRGCAESIANPAGGRALLERAFAQFETGSDSSGAILSCAGILHSFFLEWGDLHPIDGWLETFRSLWQKPREPLPQQLEIQILPALVGAMLRHAGDPFMELAVARARELIPSTSDPSQQVALGFFVALQFETVGKWAEGVELLSRLERTVDDSMSPLLEMLFCSLKITWHAMCADYGSEEGGRKEIQHFLDLRRASGIRTLDVFGLAQGVYFALNWRDQELAETLLEDMQSSVLPQRTLDVGHYNWLCAAVSLQRGDLATASAYASASFEDAQRCGSPFGVCQNHLIRAQIETLRGRPQEALEHVEFVIAYGHKVGSLPFEHAGLLVKSYVQLRLGMETEGLETLRSGLALGRSTGQTIIAPSVHADVTNQVYSAALRHGIEADHVRKLVRKLRIAPQPSALAHWPWPVRIYTLGRFALVKDGTPIRMSGKAQRKPLNLLFALIALGGRSVTVSALIRQVWAASGAAARSNFDVALVRLRRMLGRADALLLSGGKLTLNDKLCWVDVWSLERAISESGVSEADDPTGEALSLYRGRFLPDETDMACVGRMRDRLAARFLRIVLEVGKEHERAGRFECAAQVYRRGLEEDNLVEAFYQRLIFCEFKQGNRAEAIRTYRRCGQMLAESLSTRPSKETESLYQRLSSE